MAGMPVATEIPPSASNARAVPDGENDGLFISLLPSSLL